MRSSRSIPFRALSILALTMAGVVLITGIAPGAATFLTKSKAKKLFYTKGKAEKRFLTAGELGQTVEGWHEVGTAGEPVFATAPACAPGTCWRNHGSPYTSVGFYKDPFGVVHLRGAIECNAPNFCDAPEEFLMFTLPESYRPPGRVIHLALVGIIPPEHGPVYVESSGEVRASVIVPDTFGWISLDGITFRAA